jgi:hypothetical protein
MRSLATETKIMTRSLPLRLSLLIMAGSLNAQPPEPATSQAPLPPPIPELIQPAVPPAVDASVQGDVQVPVKPDKAADAGEPLTRSTDEAESEEELLLPADEAVSGESIYSGQRLSQAANWHTPRGTLGLTYYRRSHSVPADRHPRTAMLAVRDKGLVPHLSVPDMGGFRMRSGVWLFESLRPLDPGVSQVVRVEARKAHLEVEAYDVRFVRLIPGRIVYLDYKEPIGDQR